MRKAILSFMVAVALMAPFCCYGYENSYIDMPEMWLDNADTVLINIEDERLDGYLQYFTDSDSHTLYGHISHGFFVDNVPVFVGLEGNSFNIEFDENGIKDDDFNGGLSYQNNKNEVYFAVDFKNRDIRNNTDKLRITIRINGVDYLVCEQIAVDIKDPIKTTAPKQTTTKLQKEKVEKETTTKSISKSSSKKETTTKFKYTLDKTKPEAIETVTEPNTENITEPAIMTSRSDTDTAEAHLSSTAIILLVLAVSAIAVGTAMIIRSRIKSKKSDEREEIAENDTPEAKIIEEDPADHMRKINLGKDLSDYNLDDLDE